MTARVGWIGLVLAGCVSRDARIAGHLEGGFYEQALAVADHDIDRERIVGGALIEDLGLVVAMEPVPVEAFGAPPRGYGETWVLVGVGQRRAPGVADSVELEVTFDGWERCTSCDGAWMVAQMAPPVLHDAPPGVTEREGSSSGLFDLAVAMWVGTRVIAGLALVPMAAWLDTVALQGVLQQPEGSPLRPYGLTKLVFDATMRPLLDTLEPSGHAVAELGDEGIRCVGDLPCSALVVFEGSGAPTEALVEVTVHRGEILTRGVVRIPAGGAFAEAVGATFPSEGRALALERR